MLKTQIDNILKAESDARQKIVAAERRARTMIDDARVARTKSLEEQKVAARKEADEIVRQATEQAAQERERILADANEKAKAAAATDQLASPEFIKSIVYTIAGLQA